MADAILDRPPVIPLIPADVGNVSASLVRVAGALNKVLRGAIGATMEVTLAANATNSVFMDSRIGRYTFIGLMPASAHAVDILPTIWIEPSKGSAIIHHGLSPAVDMVFVALLIG
jgi:hypothetical protein